MALDDQLEIEEPADAVMNELVGPLSETSQEIGGFIWQIIASNLPRDLHWQFLAEGDKPIASVNRINDKIRFLNIYACGAFKPKLSIEVNDKFIYQDKLNFFDRYLLNSPKLTKTIKQMARLAR